MPVIFVADYAFALTKHCMKPCGRKKEILIIIVHVSEESVKMRLENSLIGLDYLQHMPH